MKKAYLLRRLLPLLSVLCMLALLQPARAQYSNSWINFSNSYYKFKISREGIYRITQPQLSALGMAGVTGDKFAIFREGQEVPIYVSTSGVLSGTDYIEFYGSPANGVMDTPLYPNGLTDQPSTDVNIITDSACYFLTYDATVHQRLSLINNSIPPVPPAPAAYCWATSSPTVSARTAFNRGLTHASNSYYVSSDFDLGEGWAYSGASAANFALSTPNVYTSGPQANMSFVWAANNFSYPADLIVQFNGNTMMDSMITETFRVVRRNFDLLAASLNAVNTINFPSTPMVQYYISYIHSLKLRYPRTYDFSGNFSSQGAFQIPAADRYLEVAGFSTGGQQARLYDRTNNKIYIGTESGGGVKFYLDASAVQRNVLITNVSSINSSLSLNSVQFRNYSQAGNQGNYIILSSGNYINASPSYISDYRQYRASAAGGSYTPVVVDVAELYDQFGYGYVYHPIGIRNFIAYALGTWATKPAYLFIVGRGVDYSQFQSMPQFASTGVPTWGEPGSDNLFSSFNNSQIPQLATGRLSAWNNAEIGVYLQKIKVYEEAIKPLAMPTVEHDFWKKRALHIAGSSDLSEQQIFVNELNNCKSILEDTLVGAVVTTIKKTTTDPVEDVNNATIDGLMNSGVSYVSFYGHGSTAGFDYNLNSPDNYNSSPRFPVFGAYACEVAHIFAGSNLYTISEQYVKSANGGAIAMIASDNTGWTGTLPTYMENIYKSWAYRDYGKPLGMQYRNNIERMQLSGLGGDFLDIHTQCQLLQGDPGTIMYNPDKIDFAIEAPGITTIPSNVTTAQDTFQMKVVLYSLGKSTRDSVLVRLQHTRSGNTAVIRSDSMWITNLLSSDTVIFKVPLDAVNDIGLNYYTIKIDASDRFDEISKDNNEVRYDLFIYSESLIPVYPKEFAIVHDQGVTLKASTLNAFAPVRNYKFEIDTTENFSSAVKQSTVINSMGGVLKWKPNLIYRDSTVYYWRAAPDSLINGGYNWSYSSFIYLANGSDGWNQSHYFQYLKDQPYAGIELPASNRKFRFGALQNVLKIEDKVVSNQVNNYQDVRQSLNDVIFDSWGCAFNGSVQFVVIDSTSGQPWYNSSGAGVPGLYGSVSQCDVAYPPRRMFEFSTSTAASRNAARLFLESIPNGDYVMIKNLVYDGASSGTPWNGQTATQWRQDSALYQGHSLYHTMRDMGFDQIDQFTSKQVFGFFMRKGFDSTKVQHVSVGADDKIDFEVYFNSYPDTAIVTSKTIGPALEWQSMKWRISSLDNAPQNDSCYMEIYGLDTLEHATRLYGGFARDTSLAFIDAKHYPNLNLKWYSVDNITRTSAQLDYWRVLYKPVPEAALNAAAHFVRPADTTSEGQKSRMEIAIENLTPYPMDSMLVSYKLIDNAGIKHVLDSGKRYKPLAANDTLIAYLDYDISQYHKSNFLLIEANPNNDQPEQYHPNNLGYMPQYIKADDENPLLDVTFDGIHILDKDIVSAKPFIKVLMRDDNKYLALNDTASMKVQLLYPGQSTPIDVPLDGTTCKFIPATLVNGTKNEARIEYRPVLAQDGVYQLAVSGKDRVGNTAGNTALSYKVNFTVENKPSITNVLNYPNPFSTSTRFIFDMTGSEVPSQFKIQILSVTGKVVREIKKNELGNLHIGRNMTDPWDGRDEFGQMLGNGVYLYRVITSIRGENVENRANSAIDKYFKNGYGKLYIMR